jgi:hypothetical protein
MSLVRRQPASSPGIASRLDQPLISVVVEEDGQEVVRYFVDEAAADAALPDAVVQDALGLAGAWSDLDWEEAIAELDRIRHQSRPTPPITAL